jgi:quercetin dioxygenase-like cupin family protein
MEIVRLGMRPSRLGEPQHFTGQIWREQIVVAPEPARVRAGFARFEPRARTAWHTHPLGQTLCILSGVGRVQAWGRVGQLVSAGDVVWIPPHEKHWHGAAPTHAMTYIAIQESDEADVHVHWLELVSENQYDDAIPAEQGFQQTGF